MKPVHIDFVEPKAWKFIWAAAAVVSLVLATATGGKVWQWRQQKAALQKALSMLQAEQLQQRLAQAKAMEPPKASPMASSEAAAMRLLQRDWNTLYDAIESPTLSKTRLLQLAFDANSGQAMLEYQMESLTQATEVTMALNAATPGAKPVWKLESLQNGNQPGAAGMAAKITGVWRAAVD